MGGANFISIPLFPGIPSSLLSLVYLQLGVKVGPPTTTMNCGTIVRDRTHGTHVTTLPRLTLSLLSQTCRNSGEFISAIVTTTVRNS